MFIVHMSDTKFVIVKCDNNNNPVGCLQNLVVCLDDLHSSLLFVDNVKAAYRFSDFETAINVLENIKALLGSEFSENITIGRIYGEDELLCLYN